MDKKVLFLFSFSLLYIELAGANPEDRLKDFLKKPRGIAESIIDKQPQNKSPVRVNDTNKHHGVGVNELPEKAKNESSKPQTSKVEADIKVQEILREETRPLIVYPLHSTPLVLNSLSLGYSQGLLYGILRFQFRAGQYDFLKKYLPKYKNLLILKPRLAAGLVGTENGRFNFFLSTDNRIKMKNYGVAFKFLVEGNQQSFKDFSFNGYVKSYVFKNLFVGETGFLSMTLGFNSPLIKLEKDIVKMASYARSLLFRSESLIAGVWFNPDVLDPNSWSVGIEANGQDFVSLSVYMGF